MTDRKRIAITVASALVLGVIAAGHQWAIVYDHGWSIGRADDPAAHIWAICGLVAYGLAIVGVFLVNRPWAVLPALTMFGFLAIGHLIHPQPDLGTEEVVLSPVLQAFVLIFAIALNAAVLSIGLLARKAWDRLFHQPNETTSKEFHR